MPIEPKESNQQHAGQSSCIANIFHTYLSRSETFIYQQVSNLSQFQSLIIAWKYQNLAQFPRPHEDCFSLTLKKGTWSWWKQGIGRRLLGRELLAERFLKRRQARLLHAHFGAMGVWALRLRRALKIPLITTFYGHDMSKKPLLAELRHGYARLFGEGDLFLVEGPRMRERLSEIGCPPDKIGIQRIAIPVADLPFRPRLAKKAGAKVVIAFSGRFVEKKGLLPALQALAMVRATAPAFEFRIIGDGPLRPAIESFVRGNGLGNCVRLLGFLDYGRYIGQMQEADLFLHPSVTAADGDSEGGAPTTILEAQALGLPVIASRHADIPHVVVADRSALLSAEGDIPGLAANIARLLADQDSWARMGEAGRRHVQENHDVAREIPRLESRYAELLSAHGR